MASRAFHDLAPAERTLAEHIRWAVRAVTERDRARLADRCVKAWVMENARDYARWAREEWASYLKARSK